MAAGASRAQALSFLTAAKNHADLAMKVSSLRQAKEILLSSDSSVSSDLLPFVADLQFSPEPLVRKSLIHMVLKDSNYGCDCCISNSNMGETRLNNIHLHSYVPHYSGPADAYFISQSYGSRIEG